MNFVKRFLIKRGIRDEIKALKKVKILEKVGDLPLLILNLATKI